MARNKRLGILLLTAFIIGSLVTVVLTSQLDITNQVAASADKISKTEEASSNEARANLSQQQENLISQFNSLFVNAADKVSPSVVTIYSAKVIEMRRYSPFEFFFNDEFFEQFFGERRRPQEEGKEDKYVKEGMGSGVIVESDGVILTNYHVIKDADDIRVKTTDGEEHHAKVIGTDPKTDLAVVKIDVTGLPTADLGDSDALEVGEWVLAIGSPFIEQLRQTVTKGIVSAKGRKGLGLATEQGYENFIQTDAAINPGNSGGALVNLYGEVVGINTAIVTPSGGFAGVGFAIPINMAREVMNELITKGKVVRGWLGVWIQNVDKDMALALGLEEKKGALVNKVESGSPADKAGIQPSDVIVEFNGVEVKSSDHLKFMVADVDPGEKVRAVVIRDGKIKTLTVNIGELGGETGEEKKLAQENAAEKMGIEVSNVTDRLSRQFGYDPGNGVVIVEIDPTSDAYRKGLREGDLIKEANRKKISDVSDFNAAINAVKPGTPVLFLAQRGKNNFFVAVEVPEE